MSGRGDPAGQRPAGDIELRATLRELRRQRGLTQRDLLRPLHLASHTAIVDYEAGRRIPAADIIEAYERFFRLPPGQLQRLRARALAHRAATETGSLLAEDAGRERQGPPVPRQLPARTPHFAGRAGDLATLDALLRSGRTHATVISAIGGMGGIGKTTLAVHWGHQVRHHFHDGDLYINLRGFHPAGRPVEPAEALRMLLAALGVALERLPATLDERAALYRSLLADRRMLVVLDNAATADQVRPLLPGTPGCVTLVTSRDRLAGLVARDGAQRIVLDVLEPAEARQVLCNTIGAARTGAEPEATAELAERCGRYPLALVVAAERVAAEDTLVTRASASAASAASSAPAASASTSDGESGAPAGGPGSAYTGPNRRPIAGTVAELADRTRRLHVLDAPGDPDSAVRAVFDWSYARLSAAAARLFRLLGLHDGPDIPVGAVAALARTSPRQVAGLLRELAAAHLVTPVGRGRYGCHDLVGVYAAGLVAATDSDADRRAARRRLIGWYVHSACAARSALTPSLPPMEPEPVDLPVAPAGFASAAEALAWFEAERANLVAVVRSAERDGLYRIGWQVPTAMYGFFDLRKYYDDWLATHEIALRCARMLGDREAQGRILCNTGNAFQPMRRDEEAIECYRRALALFEETGYRQGQAKVWGNLGTSFDRLSLADEAARAHERSLEIFREIGDRYGEALTVNNIGEMHLRAGRPEPAARRLRQAMDIFRAIGDGHGVSRATGNLGVALAALGDTATGLELLAKALDGFQASGDRWEAANTVAQTGDIHARLGDRDAATACWRTAVELYAQSGDSALAAVVATRL